MPFDPNNKPMAELVETLIRLDLLTREKEVQDGIGEGLLRELRYPIASFRQRFPGAFPVPAAQITLF